MANTIAVRGKTGGRARIVDVDIGYTVSLSTLALSSDDASPLWYIFLDRVLNDLPVPPTPTFTTATTGGSIPRRKHIFVRITALDGTTDVLGGRVINLESQPSAGVNRIVVGTTTDTNTVAVTWTAVAGATGYNIYAGTRSGMENFIATVGVVLTYTITALTGDVLNAMQSNPDFSIYGKSRGNESVEFSGSVPLSQRLIVYAETGGNANIGFSCIVS